MSSSGTHRRATMLAALGAVAALLGGCARPEPSVGVSYDRPGLGVRATYDLSGFDYVLARDLAARLGHPGPKDLAYVAVPERRVTPQSPDLPYDVLVAAYPVTPALRARTDLVGPYLRGRQEVAVRASDQDTTTAASLSGRTVCAVLGSELGRTSPRTFPGAHITYRETVSTCLTELRHGQVDAVTDEGLALRGYVANAPFRGSVKVVDLRLPSIDYYIAVSRRIPGLCGSIRDALQSAVRDGSWSRVYAEQLVRTGVVGSVPAPPATITGCDG
ncbi:transporter substrate-binding domain-containing protein [Arsenicicoccus dermatophilus]|uniref:transporter substrate-binding domain-containing protein n=1 Tax=Arsenicicoccus dermatophilus TaxID=1076331 RepID=UPI00391708A2